MGRYYELSKKIVGQLIDVRKSDNDLFEELLKGFEEKDYFIFREALKKAEQFTHGQTHDLIEHHALSIGMDQWRRDARTINTLFVEDLKYPITNVHVLRGPTRREVLDKISSLNKVSFGPKDVFIVYYSGHGSMDEKEFMFKTQKESLSQTEMMNAVENLSPQNVVFIVDACRAG